MDSEMIMEKTLDGFATEKINTISNNLLGTYDKNGNYDISQPIKDELLKLVKHKKSTFNNSVFCVVNRPGLGELVFKIDYEKNTSDNLARATMYVLENVYKVNGYLQDTIKTKVAEYIGGIDGFIDNSYTKFNVTNDWSGDNDDEGREYLAETPSAHSYINAQKQFVDALNRLTTDKYNKLYEDFFAEKLKVINSLGNEFGKAVLDDFRQEYTKVEKFFLSNKDYKALSELLDVCVERHTMVKEPVGPAETAQKKMEQDYFDKIENATKVFTKKAEEVRENAVEKAKSRLEEPEKKLIVEIEKPVVKKETIIVEKPSTPSAKTEVAPEPKVELPKADKASAEDKPVMPVSPAPSIDVDYVPPKAKDEKASSPVSEVLTDLLNHLGAKGPVVEVKEEAKTPPISEEPKVKTPPTVEEPKEGTAPKGKGDADLLALLGAAAERTP